MSKKTYEEIKDSTYCYFAMHSFSIHAHGKARMCCVGKDDSQAYLKGENNLIDLRQVLRRKHTVEDNIGDFVNNPTLTNIRKEMLEGTRPEACKRCWNLEDNGIQSFRQIQNITYKDFINQDLSNVSEDGKIDIEEIKYLDITLGNVCNLKCRTCNPWASHRWIEEGPVLPYIDWSRHAYATGRLSSDDPWFIKAFKDGFFDKVLPNVNAINFLGGEPLVVKEHYDWLEYIVERGWSKNIKLFYNTNGTTLPKRLLDIWQEFQCINLGLSIDAIGDLSYYVRHPSKWHVIENNIKKLAEYAKEHKNVFVQTHVTLSSINLHDLPNIIDWCRKNYDTWHYQYSDGRRYWGNYGYQNCLPHFNIVEYPYYFHIRHLPDEIKLELSEMIDRQYEKVTQWDLKEWEKIFANNLLGIKSTLNLDRDETEWMKFIENTKASDKFRDVSILDYVPWSDRYFS